MVNSENWFELNALVKAKLFDYYKKTNTKLNLNDKSESDIDEKLSSLQIRTYKGMAHAVYEIVYGLAQFYSHKKSMINVKGNTVDLQSVLPYLIKDSFQVQSFSIGDLQSKDSAQLGEAFHNLNKDTGFCFFSSDHPITAETWDWRSLDQHLNDKKIFSVRVSHFDWYQYLEVNPYSVQLISLSKNYCIALCGSRFRPPPVMSPFLSWDEESISAEIETILSATEVDKNQILDFEKKMAVSKSGWQVLLNTENRTFDRSIIFHSEINSDLIKNKLESELNLVQDQYLMSTSQCKWKNPRIFNEIWTDEVSAEKLRGMLIIKSKLLSHNSFLAQLEKITLDEIKNSTY